jgi:hypothetical protein
MPVPGARIWLDKRLSAECLPGEKEHHPEVAESGDDDESCGTFSLSD